MTNINWGIIAPGGIARSFATALNSISTARCYGIAGRSIERSRAFAQDFGFDRAFANYSELLADPKVDVIYIASPHSAHQEHALACIRAGKAALCEKPIAVNFAQTEEILNAAAEHNVFFMEALWTRFLPVYAVIREWLDEGLIGDVRLVQSSFGLRRPFDAEHRLFNPNLAGGSILDLGIYPVSLVDWVYGEAPDSINATGRLGATGVDEEMAAILSYSDGRTAQISAALTTQTSHAAMIYGTHGHVKVHAPAHGSEAATLVINSHQSAGTTVSLPHAVNGYVFEAQEVQRCLHGGQLESKIMSWSTSARIIRILDELRAQVGVKYPFENIAD